MNEAGNTQLFTEDPPNANRSFGTRDAMVLPIGTTYYCYYTARDLTDPENRSADYVRTSLDLRNWGPAEYAFTNEKGGHWSMECPHVVERFGAYYHETIQGHGVVAGVSVI